MESKVLKLQRIVKGDNDTQMTKEQEFEVRYSLRNIIWLERKVGKPIGSFFNDDMKDGHASLDHLFTFVMAGLAHKEQGIKDLDHLIDLIDEHASIGDNQIEDIIEVCMDAMETSSVFKAPDEEEVLPGKAEEVEDEKKP